MTDSTDSVSVSSGDWLDFEADIGGDSTYSYSFNCASARFDAADNTTSASKASAMDIKKLFLAPPLRKRYMREIPPPFAHYVQQMRIFAGKQVCRCSNTATVNHNYLSRRIPP